MGTVRITILDSLESMRPLAAPNSPTAQETEPPHSESQPQPPPLTTRATLRTEGPPPTSSLMSSRRSFSTLPATSSPPPALWSITTAPGKNGWLTPKCQSRGEQQQISIVSCRDLSLIDLLRK